MATEKNCGSLPIDAALDNIKQMMLTSLSQSMFQQPAVANPTDLPSTSGYCFSNSSQNEATAIHGQQQQEKKKKKKKKHSSSSRSQANTSTTTTTTTTVEAAAVNKALPNLSNLRPPAQTSSSQMRASQNFNPVFIAEATTQPLTTSMDSGSVKKIIERIDDINKRVVRAQKNITDIDATLKRMENAANARDERLAKVEEMTKSIHEMLKQITAKNSIRARTRPPFLPFKTCADLLEFNNATAEQYNNLVHYLMYLGGNNSTDAASKYFKSCIVMDEDMYRNMTWCSNASKNNVTILKDTRFAKACQDAMPCNQQTLEKPNAVEFSWAMTKALKSAKELMRKKLKRPAAQQHFEDEPRQRVPRMEENVPVANPQEHPIVEGGEAARQAIVQQDSLTSGSEDTEDDESGGNESSGTRSNRNNNAIDSDDDIF